MHVTLFNKQQYLRLHSLTSWCYHVLWYRLCILGGREEGAEEVTHPGGRREERNRE